MPQERARTPVSGWQQGMCALSEHERDGSHQGLPGLWVTRGSGSQSGMCYREMGNHGNHRTGNGPRTFQGVKRHKAEVSIGQARNGWGGMPCVTASLFPQAENPVLGVGETRDWPGILQRPKSMDDQPAIRGTTDPHTTWTRLWSITQRASGEAQRVTHRTTPFTQKS